MKPKRTLLLTVLALLPVACTSTPNSNGTAQASATDCAPVEENAAQIAAAKLIIEYNATDGDMGIHGGFDDHGWSELCVYAPDGTQVLAVKPQVQLMNLTMAGIFFESREPPEDEFTFEDLKAVFPAGEYTVRGITFEGVSLTGAATFTHDLPEQPAITSPALAEDEETAAEATVAIDGLVIQWEPVTDTIDGRAATITGYEVIVTKVDHDDPHGFSQPVYDVHLSPDRNSLSVPVEFLEPGTVYELEVLAIEVSGNQTISVGFFTTE